MDKAFKARGYVLQGMLGEGAFAKVLLCKNIKCQSAEVREWTAL